MLYLLITGIIGGFLYALLFIMQHSLLFKYQVTTNYRTIISMSLVRFTILGCYFYFVLHSVTANRILILISFMIAFLTTLLWNRLYAHARS